MGVGAVATMKLPLKVTSTSAMPTRLPGAKLCAEAVVSVATFIDRALDVMPVEKAFARVTVKVLALGTSFTVKVPLKMSFSSTTEMVTSL